MVRASGYASHFVEVHIHHFHYIINCERDTRAVRGHDKPFIVLESRNYPAIGGIQSAYFLAVSLLLKAIGNYPFANPRLNSGAKNPLAERLPFSACFAGIS